MDSPLALPRPGQPWTIEDLVRLPPDDTMQYELVDGSLLVSPHADVRHSGVAIRLCRLLDRQAPPQLLVGQDTGLDIRSRTTYYEPDIVVAPGAAFDRARGEYLDPSAVLLVVEVLSTYNRGHDLVRKRHDYAVAGIPRYWIVDPDGRTLTVLTRGDDGHYADRAVVRPGESWSTGDPFPLTLDPADFV